jgi:2'-5' RNA ligase
MPKLFVAVGLPAPVATELTRIQPPPTIGVRRTELNQLHLTLHFLGEANVGRIAAALEAVSVLGFALAFTGVGQFCSADGAVTLSAGVQESAGLLRLHTAIATALAGEGFRPEVRQYNPHVTLARCQPGAEPAVVADFLTRNAGFSLPAVEVAAFGLYSSVFIDESPVYRLERSFALRQSSATH